LGGSTGGLVDAGALLLMRSLAFHFFVNRLVAIPFVAGNILLVRELGLFLFQSRRRRYHAGFD